MGRLIDTVGNYAEKPYIVPQVVVPVYCVEELCYILCNNAFLLDRSIMDVDLAKWLDEQCGLPELSKALYPLIHQKGTPSALAGIILEYAHYGTERERKEIEDLFRESADMDITDKMKNHGDYMVKSGLYAQAVREYDNMLSDYPALNHTFRSELLHNKGVALCRLFEFKEAADSFLRALEENPDNRKAELGYLGALRMRLSKEDYIAFVAEHSMWYGASLELEKEYNRIEQEFETSSKKQYVSRLLEKKWGSDFENYYDEISKCLAEKKQAYREMIVET